MKANPMKNMFCVGVAAWAVLGLGSMAMAADREAPAPGCDKDCQPQTGTQPKPLAATARRDAPSRGPSDARVTVEVWSDFQCPFCRRGAQTLAQLRQKYGDQIRIVFRQAPLPFHEKARPAALAALAAHEQGHFWEFHDALFADEQPLDRESLESLAQKLGLDVTRFRRSLEANTWKAYLDQEIAEMHNRGITGTPTFFINDKPLVGSQPLGEFTKLIDAALAH